MNTHTIVADMHWNVSKIRGDVGDQNQVVCGTPYPALLSKR